jgi:hypothetical protein
MTNNRFQYFNFIGNNAFSITKEVLQMIAEHPPLTTRLITQSDAVCFVPGYDPEWTDIFNNLKVNTGLEKVHYLSDKFFTQHNTVSTVFRVLLHCTRGYTGPIKVYDTNEQLIYVAERSAEFLPQTVEAHKISLLPTVGQVDLHAAAVHDPRQYLSMYQTTVGFVQDTVADCATRDSLLSLMKTGYFTTAYQSMASTGLGIPVLEYLLKKFPSDCTWDQPEVEHYVQSNSRS